MQLFPLISVRSLQMFHFILFRFAHFYSNSCNCDTMVNRCLMPQNDSFEMHSGVLFFSHHTRTIFVTCCECLVSWTLSVSSVNSRCAPGPGRPFSLLSLSHGRDLNVNAHISTSLPKTQQPISAIHISWAIKESWGWAVLDRSVFSLNVDR